MRVMSHNVPRVPRLVDSQNSFQNEMIHDQREARFSPLCNVTE